MGVQWTSPSSVGYQDQGEKSTPQGNPLALGLLLSFAANSASALGLLVNLLRLRRLASANSNPTDVGSTGCGWVIDMGTGWHWGGWYMNV